MTYIPQSLVCTGVRKEYLSDILMIASDHDHIWLNV